MKIITVLKNAYPSKTDMRMIGFTLLIALPFATIASIIPIAITAAVYQLNFWGTLIFCVLGAELGIGLISIIIMFIINAITNNNSKKL